MDDDMHEPSRQGGDGTHAPQAVLSAVTLSQRDYDTLVKLRQAGLIEFDVGVLPTVKPEHVEWSYEAFVKHMTGTQRLRLRTKQGIQSTALNRAKYIRFLESHDEAPVELRPPSEESWLGHVAWRFELPEAGGTALNHYRKSLQSLLRFLGIPIWPSLVKPFEEIPAHWTLPPERLVPKFWLHTKHPLRYIQETIQHVFHLGFHTGLRPPSEFAALRLDDIDYETNTITVTEIKKGGKRRDLDGLPPFILAGTNCKSLRNYIEQVRPRVDRGESDAVFLNTEGRPWNPVRLGSTLGEMGRQVWPQFIPYTMRRWFATEFLIQNDFSTDKTADRIGDNATTVKKYYLEKAKVRAAMKGQFKIRRLVQRAGDA